MWTAHFRTVEEKARESFWFSAMKKVFAPRPLTKPVERPAHLPVPWLQKKRAKHLQHIIPYYTSLYLATMLYYVVPRYTSSELQKDSESQTSQGPWPRGLPERRLPERRLPQGGAQKLVDGSHRSPTVHVSYIQSILWIVGPYSGWT